MSSLLALAISIALATPAPPADDGHVQVAVRLDEDGVQDFRLAVGRHYHADERAMLAVRKSKVPDEEWPVLFHVAGHAHVGPDVVIGLRAKGMSWMAITAHFGLGADIFYVPITGSYGPPYGKAYGHFKNRKRSEWASIQLADVEIVHLTQVKFLSATYGLSPDDVIKMHGKGASFVKLHGAVEKRAKEKGERRGGGKDHERGGKPDAGGSKAGRGSRGKGKKGK